MKELQVLKSLFHHHWHLQNNWNNIVNPTTGRFILNYDEKIFEDDRELELKVRHAREDYGEFSKEYLRAKHERDKWLIRNKEQQYVSEYYQYIYDNEDKVLDNFMIDYYIQYLKLKDEYHKLLGISKADRTEAINNQIKTLRHNINQMMDIYDDVTGEFKDENSIKRANRLKSYSEEVEKIKKAFFVRETRLGFKKDLEHYLKVINKYNKKINGKQVISEYELLQIPEYAEAVDWFNENTIYSPNEDFIKQLNEAYSTMSNGRKRQYPQFTSIVEATKGCKDIYGVINGRMFNDEQIAAIKREQELIYDNETNDTNGETKLIRNRPDNDEIYSEKFYKGFKSSDEKLNKKKISTIREINAILIKAVHPISGKIRLSELSIEYELTRAENEDLKKNDLSIVAKRLAELLKQDVLENVFENEKGVGAVFNNELIAMILFLNSKIIFKNRKINSIYFYAVCTEQNYRNQGVMRSLFAFAKEMAKEQGAEVCFLVPENESLFKMYEKFSFERNINFKERSEKINGNKTAKTAQGRNKNVTHFHTAECK